MIQHSYRITLTISIVKVQIEKINYSYENVDDKVLYNRTHTYIIIILIIILFVPES